MWRIKIYQESEKLSTTELHAIFSGNTCTICRNFATCAVEIIKHSIVVPHCSPLPSVGGAVINKGLRCQGVREMWRMGRGKAPGRYKVLALNLHHIGPNSVLRPCYPYSSNNLTTRKKFLKTTYIPTFCMFTNCQSETYGVYVALLNLH